MNILKNSHILQVGDSAIEIRMGNQIDREVNQRVYLIDLMISRAEISGVIETIPSYASLMIIYDPLLVSQQKLRYRLTHLLKNVSGEYFPESSLIEIPVVYGGVDGPDLAEVARLHSLSVDEVISIHCGTEYQVYMMGFTPGFPYLGDLSPLLSTPRLAQPRKVVPAGSVGIAGNQTGIYPIQSPGGWRIIGRTYLKLFDPDGDPPFLIRPGDRIRFIPEMEHSV